MDSQRFDSDPFGMLLGKLPALNVDIPSNPAEERSIQASVSQELDYFEKIVFSFDMDKGPTNASGGSGDDSKDGNEGNSRQSRSVASTSSSNSQADSYFSQIDPRLLDALYTSVNNRANQSQPTGAPTTTHVPSMTPPFDPYIIAHAAALSALASAPQQFQQFPGLQGDNRDPAAFMRAMYSSVTPALTSTGHAQSGPSASGSQSYPWLPPTGLPTLSQLQSVSTQGQAASSRVSRSASTSSSRDVRTRPEAGPSQPTRGRRQSLPAPRTPVTPVGEEEGDQPFDESAIIEDKRRRNTAASGMSFQPLSHSNWPDCNF